MHNNKIGFWALFSIVTASQIGSGIFVLPISLSSYGIWGLLGYLLASCGALALCFVFAGLCAKLPYTGGPHVYVQHVFGEIAGFFSGWTYWLINLFSSIAVIVTSIHCLSPFFPNYDPKFYLLLEIILLIVVTIINLKGIKIAGNIELFLAILKFIPLIILPIIVIINCKNNNIIDQNFLSVKFNINNLGKVTFLVLWGFIGLESGTTVAESVYRPTITIPKAIILGTFSVALLYILNFIGIVGVVPSEILIHSKAPYVDVVQYIFGGNWHLLISITISVVCIGSLNALILTIGQIILGLSQDRLMPKIFSKKNNHGAPVIALIVSNSLVALLLIFMSYKNFAEQLLIIIDLSITSFVFVYLICCLSYFKLLLQEKNYKINNYFIGLIACIFCIWVIYSTPINILLLSCLFTISGIPMYFLWYKKYN